MMADEGATPPRAHELMEPAPAPPMPEPVTATKPRGRPRGSKNKPKPPVVVTRESQAALRPVLLEVAAGCDVVAAVSAFARRRGVGVSVLCGRGAVAAVTLRLPTSPTTASTVTLHGRFEVLALSGTVLTLPSASPPPAFSVSLAGSGGQVIGGMLAGEMTAAADGMVVVAATFGSAEVHRLPPTEDQEEGGDGRGGLQDVKPPHQPQQPIVVAPGAGGVALGGGVTTGLGGGHVGYYQQQPHMVFWPHPSSSHQGSVQQSSHFY